MAKFGTKNDLFRYFWTKIFKKVMSYLKSAPSRLSKNEKTIMFKFATKNALFGHF